MKKYNIRRIKHLIAMLKENRYPNFPRFVAEMKKMDIAGVCKLSSRTLLRDIAFLKSEYNAPIEYDYSNKGYYLTIPDWSIDIPFLEDDEMQSAVLGARIAENIMPPPVKEKMRSAVDSLLAVNEKGLDEYTQLLSLVALGSNTVIVPEIFDTVFRAWQKQQCLYITYEQIMGNISERIIEPHALVFYEGNWYLKAVTRSKNGSSIPSKERIAGTFAVHRVQKAAICREKFTPDRKIIDAVNRREIFDFPMVKDIELRLGIEAYKFIGEEFDVTVQQKEGDHFIVKIAAAPEYKIVNYILSEGGDAELLNHPELAAEVIKRAEQTIKVHNKTKK